MTTTSAEFSVSSPGRINIIGDHTDYTGGLVLPMVVDLHTTLTGATTDDRMWHLDSDSHGHADIDLDIERAEDIEPAWARYPAGVLVELRSLGIPITGFTGTVTTTVPIGAGLSSSAALEIATARVVIDHMQEANRIRLSDIEIAQICRRAEHAATGVPCGIMDQLSIASGRAGCATLIDCGTLEIEYVTIPDFVRVEHRFVTARTLVGSEYAERVDQCRQIESHIGPLRVATFDDVERLPSDVLRRRARHVVSENSRVRAFVAALSTGNVQQAGALMTESHRSLSVDYETSTSRMDAAVRSALNESGVLGARMTGGGFGGCIVILRRA